MDRSGAAGVLSPGAKPMHQMTQGARIVEDKDTPAFVEFPVAEQVFLEPPDRPARSLYSNAAQVSVTNEDVSVAFGVRDVNDAKIVHVTLRVFMSHSHAKRLVGALARSIQSLEAVVGEIELHPGAKQMKAGTAKLLEPKQEK